MCGLLLPRTICFLKGATVIFHKLLEAMSLLDDGDY